MRITFSVTGMLVVASFHALPSSSLADFTCQSEEDCHLNGICTPQGACVCDAPWTGSEDCGVLSFRPVSATPPECGYPGCIYRGDGKTTDYSWFVRTTMLAVKLCACASCCLCATLRRATTRSLVSISPFVLRVACYWCPQGRQHFI